MGARHLTELASDPSPLCLPGSQPLCRLPACVPLLLSEYHTLRPTLSPTRKMVKKVAVLLAGCGVYDGSEINESSAVLVHLSRAGAQEEIYAPNIEQMHVVDHATGKPTQETRNVLVESGRIARGCIKDLSELNVSELDAIILPGGYGAAKNLCTWAVKGKDCTVNQVVEDTLKAFHAAKKPIGFCCIAPVLAAKIFPGCEVTVGHDTVCEKWPYAQTAQDIKHLGCTHVNKDVHEVHVDTKNKLVTTSAFMCNAPLHEVFDGIGEMVTKVLELA